MLPPNFMIIDRIRHEQLARGSHKGYSIFHGFGGYRIVAMLDFAAIKELDGSYTVVKNKFTGKCEYKNEQQLLEDIGPFINPKKQG